MLCADPLRIRVGELLAWVVPVGLIAGLAGAWPTWWLAGHDGLLGLAAAGVAVLAAGLASAALTAALAPRGAAKATLAFVCGGTLRLLLVGGLALVAVWLLPMCPKTFLIWLAVFYVAMLAGQSAWMCRALRRGGGPAAGSRPERGKDQGPSENA